MNPFELNGPQFLELYTVLFAGAFVLWGVSFFLAWVTSPGPDDDGVRGDHDPWLLAFVSGGREGAVRAAMVSLEQRGAVELNYRSPRRTSDTPPQGLSRFERSVWHALDPHGLSWPGQLFERLEPALERLADDAVRRGLVPAGFSAWLRRSFPVWMFAALGVLAVARVFQGVSRHRPVGLLLMFLFMVAGALVLTARKRSLQTRRGHALLREQSAANVELSDHVRTPDGLTSLDPRTAALACALFAFTPGAAAMTGVNASLGLPPPPPLATPGSGSSCSSGSSCGGGCGGGCGGCGG